VPWGWILAGVVGFAVVFVILLAIGLWFDQIEKPLWQQ
jgi:hypothetical protein